MVVKKKKEVDSKTLIEAFKSGTIYKELDDHFKTNKSEIAKHRKRNKQIDEISREISKKEKELMKCMNDIVRLKNKMSGLIHKELNAKK